MALAFWRKDSPEQQLSRARESLLALTPEQRQTFTIGGTGQGFDSGDWVNLYPSAGDDLHAVSASKAFSRSVAVYACVSLIAESIASLPLLTYERIDDRSRKRIGEQNDSPGPFSWQNRLARLLHNSPNPEMTSQELWETVLGHVALWGNAYCNVVRTNGRPDQLWPLRPDCMEIERDEKRVRRYKYTLPNGEPKYLAPEAVMHVRGMSLDGVTGVSPIGVARSAVKIDSAAASFIEGFYNRGTAMNGFLKTDTPLRGSPEQKQDEIEAFQRQFEDKYGGFSNAHRLAVLDGVSWQNVGMPLRDAEFINTLKWELGQIARLYRIPPHMVGDVEKSTSWGTGIEQQSIGFVTFTLRPWIRRVEQAINRDLGYPSSGETLLDEKIYAQFQVADLLRGDSAARAAYYASGLQNQWLVPNDARVWEDLEPLPGGDEVIQPAGAPPNEPEPEPEDSPALKLVQAESLRVRRLESEMRDLDLRVALQPQPQPQITVNVPERQTLVEIQPAAITVEPAEVNVTTPEVNVTTPDIHIEAPQPLPPSRMVRKVERDADSNIVRVIDEPEVG